MYNIDDDRVYFNGFSDGGSAAYFYAMSMPSDFAAFVALNGHPSVAGLDGKLSTYTSNLAGVPMYAINTFGDQLYPARQMRDLIDLARHAGGEILYRELDGEHSMSYAESEFLNIADYLERHPRDPFPTRIEWETASPRFGRCHWLAIDEIDSGGGTGRSREQNIAAIDSAVSIGVIPEFDFVDRGVRVSSLLDGDYLARRLGLDPGDTIVKAGGIDIAVLGDLIRFKEEISPGDDIEFVIKRGGKRLTLTTQMPILRPRYFISGERPSAEARVSYSANTFEVEALRLKSFRILIHPQMVNLSQKVRVAVSGKEVFKRHIDPDPRFILRNFLENRDRKALYVNEVKIAL